MSSVHAVIAGRLSKPGCDSGRPSWKIFFFFFFFFKLTAGFVRVESLESVAAGANRVGPNDVTGLGSTEFRH